MTRQSDYKLPQLDIQALQVLYTLLSLCSVTKTAARMDLSQPAVSITLRRLRMAFADELLVRAGNNMVPTTLGTALMPVLKTSLDSLADVFATNEPFDPSTSHAAWRLGCPDYLATVYLTEVVEILRKEAPNASVTIYPLTKDLLVANSLSDGTLDIVIGNWPQPPENLHTAPLLADDLVCLMARDHPLAGGMSQTQYFEAGHVVPLPFAPSYRGVIDQYLDRMKLSRRAMVTVPYFNLAPYILVNTDLIFTISKHFANFYANLLPLTVCPCPVDYPRMEFYLLWHARSQKDDGHRWLRQVLSRASQKLNISPRGNTVSA